MYWSYHLCGPFWTPQSYDYDLALDWRKDTQATRGEFFLGFVKSLWLLAIRLDVLSTSRGW